MKILNADLTPRLGVVETDKPDVISFIARGRRFVFDANSLRLVQVDSDEELTQALSSGARFKPRFPFYSVAQPRYVVLGACHACNFKCSYCSVQAYYPGIGMMDFDTARKAIHYFFPSKEALSRASLGFFGGEPLLNWDLVTQVIQYFEGLCHPRRPHFHITTNGALIGSKQATFLAARDCSFIVSLDGPKEVHNTCRVYKSGKGTFDDVMKGLSYLKGAGVSRRITLRATFTPETADTLLERAKFLNQLRYDGYANWVSIEPAFVTESLCFDRERVKEGIRDVRALEEQYLKVADWFVAEVQAGRRPAFHNLSKPIERLLWAIHSGTECGGGVGYFSANGKGELFACHREQSSCIGNLAKGGIDEELRAKWRDNRIYHRKGCMECPVRYVCGGGCREISIGENDDIHKPFKTACELWQIFFRTAAWIMSELGPEKLAKIVPLPKKAVTAQASKR